MEATYWYILYDRQRQSMDWVLTVAFIELLCEFHGLKTMGLSIHHEQWSLCVEVLHTNLNYENERIFNIDENEHSLQILNTNTII